MVGAYRHLHLSNLRATEGSRHLQNQWCWWLSSSTCLYLTVVNYDVCLLLLFPRKWLRVYIKPEHTRTAQDEARANNEKYKINKKKKWGFQHQFSPTWVQKKNAHTWGSALLCIFEHRACTIWRERKRKIETKSERVGEREKKRVILVRARFT